MSVMAPNDGLNDRHECCPRFFDEGRRARRSMAMTLTSINAPVDRFTIGKLSRLRYRIRLIIISFLRKSNIFDYSLGIGGIM
jgi:hypothetical protein